jgi:hypothetical protein
MVPVELNWTFKLFVPWEQYQTYSVSAGEKEGVRLTGVDVTSLMGDPVTVISIALLSPPVDCVALAAGPV